MRNDLHVRRTLLSACLMSVAAAVLHATTEPPNPYSSIAVRNVFALCSPPVLPEETRTTAPTNPPPDITLSGIADFSLAKWVLLTVAEKGKPPQNYTLGLGEKQDGLEVLEINAEAGSVKVRLQETELLLNLKTHSTQNESVRLAVQGRDFVRQFQPFVDEHTRAHTMREKREQERRDRERAEYLRATAAPAQSQNNEPKP